MLKDLSVPMAVVLEGGYAPPLIAEAAANVVSALLGPDRAERPTPIQIATVDESAPIPTRTTMTDSAGGGAGGSCGSSSGASDDTDTDVDTDADDADWNADLEGCDAPDDDADHPDFLNVARILDGIRRKLNTMNPWKSDSGGPNVFCESGADFADHSDRELHKLNRLMLACLGFEYEH
jgi:hypothetical protein